MSITTPSQIADQLIQLLGALEPEIHLRPMYGGTVLELQKGESANRIGGVFVYKHHASVEFTNGATLKDPHHFLEGAGKFRRHLKLREISDLTAKGCLDFIVQAKFQIMNSMRQ